MAVVFNRASGTGVMMGYAAEPGEPLSRGGSRQVQRHVGVGRAWERVRGDGGGLGQGVSAVVAGVARVALDPRGKYSAAGFKRRFIGEMR